MPEKKLTEEDEATTIASVRLAYQDLSIKAKKEEEKLKTLDPAKAKQMERLGMGFNRRGYVDFFVLNFFLESSLYFRKPPSYATND